MPSQPETLSRWRFRLPHWEVAEGRYFITLRCQGSLPPDALARIADLQAEAARIAPSSEPFATHQRVLFRTLEKYLDSGYGLCPFEDSRCAERMAELLQDMAEGWHVLDWVLMPNHVHLLAETRRGAAPLREHWKRFKGRSAHDLNQILGRSGALWQPDWFDRWIRNDDEFARTRAYIQRNPEKAGLTGQWLRYPWRSAELQPASENLDSPSAPQPSG